MSENIFAEFSHADRVIAAEDYRRELADCRVPEHCRPGLIDYLVEGRPPGDFLRAVLENDLKDACGRADHINLRALPEYVRFLYNHAPAPSWGSPEKVQQWLADFEAARAVEPEAGDRA